MSSYAAMHNRIDLNIDPNPMSDEGLIAAAQSGQEWAFVELCTRNSKRVYNTIYGVTRNREDAEDALQESILRAYVHLEQFDGRSSFATWFTRIGINSALMILRRARGRRETSLEPIVEGEQQWQIADYSKDPEKHYAGRERSMHFRRALSQLPPVLRSVVEQGQMEGHSIKEIAHKMGISVPATKSRLARARVALRNSMT
jgi:RNA polymerase sigma factor (sigma-70 family)